MELPSLPPRKQLENRHLWNDGRTASGADFFTFGYIGRSLPEVIAILNGAGVATVFDIRSVAVSMYKPAFSKRNLSQGLQAAGIAYVHLPELGVPRDIRAGAAAAGTRETIWEWYDEAVLEKFFTRNLNLFLNGAEHPVALMCVEVDPTQCHRHRIFLELEGWGLTGFDL